MAKFHYVTRTFTEGSSVVSAPAPIGLLTRIATRTTSDTYVRSVWQPRVVVKIDPVVSPPPDDWWTAARVIMSVRFDSTGTGGAGSGPYLASTIGTEDLYPTVVRGDTSNAEQYVIFAPLYGPLKFTTARKGDGVNFPRVIASIWNTDHVGVFVNPGGIFSVKTSWELSATVVWASDSP